MSAQPRSRLTGRRVLHGRTTWLQPYHRALLLLFQVWQFSEAEVVQIVHALFPAMIHFFGAKLRDQHNQRWANGRCETDWRILDRPNRFSHAPYTQQELQDFAAAVASIVTEANTLGITLTLQATPNRRVLALVPPGTAGLPLAHAPQPAQSAQPVLPVQPPQPPQPAPPAAAQPTQPSAPVATQSADPTQEAAAPATHASSQPDETDAIIGDGDQAGPVAQKILPGQPTSRIVPMIHSREVQFETNNVFWRPSPAVIFNGEASTVSASSALYRLGGPLYDIIDGPLTGTVHRRLFRPTLGTVAMICNTDYCGVCNADNLASVNDPLTCQGEDRLISSSDETVLSLISTMRGRPLIHCRDTNEGGLVGTLRFCPNPETKATPYSTVAYGRSWQNCVLAFPGESNICTAEGEATLVDGRVCGGMDCMICVDNHSASIKQSDETAVAEAPDMEMDDMLNPDAYITCKA